MSRRGGTLGEEIPGRVREGSDEDEDERVNRHRGLPETEKVVVDFSLWDFCPRVRTTGPSWRSDRSAIGALATMFRRRTTTLPSPAIRRVLEPGAMVGHRQPAPGRAGGRR